ncbi:hypothetical protein HPP92_001244 [Vanilla planifolia]|uniref:Vacuolar protein sorting-associated protein 13 DH-like domain-containing protein n=1 Tax=Vanilla planifolia TaxID=51239 RepID=A0A835VJH5_VANPL|nr:hypothetical protein HPP92_001244 [Vanilla planifolia]
MSRLQPSINNNSILDPLLPEQELALPLHLAETGHIRFHPVGTNYLWSEAQSLPNILLHENRPGLLRSFVCYPTQPSSDPFRCCISVEDYSLSSFGAARKCPSLIHNVTEKSKFKNIVKGVFNVAQERKYHIHHMKIITPFLVKNSLPISLALVVESCGFSHSIVIAKGNSASCFAVDSTHDLEVTYRIEDRNHEHKGIAHIILPSYQILEQEQVEDGKQGLASLTSQFKSFQGFVSMEEKVKQSSYLFLNSSMNGDRDKYPEYPSGKAGNSVESTVHSLSEEAMPYMYDPVDHIPAAELLVSLAASSNLIRDEKVHRMTWSAPFPLAPSSGSTNVTIPKSNATGAFLISATLITAMGELSGRTKAIAFQPRYIICNACNKDLCFKQKGTNIFNYLPVGKHCHLHLSDVSRELLVSLRFNDRGWQWSGCFLPDCLGDVQLKMRNYISGELIMIRVEVQNADLALRDEKLIPRSDGSYSTQLILLSEDKTGFMPYRIDNFSMERLRIYQHRCESMETIVHPYTSSKYAWDEPYYAHRIIVEVPGEQILGTYNLDNIQEDAPIHLPSTSEKPERKLFISVHADGAMKVLSIIDSSYHIVRDTIGSNFAGAKDKRKSEPEVNFSEVVKFHFPFVGISLMSSNPKELIFMCVRGATTVFMQSSEKQKFISQISSLQIDNQQSDTPYPVVVSFDNENKGRSMDSSKYKDNFLQNQHDDMGSSIIGVPVFYLSASKWRRSDVLLVSFEYITLRLAPLCLELDEQFILCLLEFSRNVYSRLQRTSAKSFHQGLVYCNEGSYNLTWYKSSSSATHDAKLLPSVAAMGAPWQPIYLLARRQKKIYIGVLELAPINISVSFSSTPWMVRNEVFVEVEKLTCFNCSAFQRGIMALVDVEGVPILLGQLSIQHLMASPRSLHDILVRHYMRQLLHGIYKLFGSVGVIGNPLGFARNIGLGIKDFMSVSSRSVIQSPFGILTGVVEGSKSLFSNTIYALSSATTQFSKSAHKWIVAFTFNEQTVANNDMLCQTTNLHSKGVLNEFLEGLTGFLQSPIRGAEKHGLPGVLSGVAMGTIGLVARPVASLLEGTAKTAQSIRNRSSPHLSSHRRVRLPRPLARELPLSPYSWEDAIGLTMLQQADGAKYKDEIYVICKSLKMAGKFIVISEQHVLVVYCSCLVGLGLLDFAGVPSNLTWVIEMEMKLESIVLVDRTDASVNIVVSNAEVTCRHKKVGSRHKSWVPPISAPFIYLSVELPSDLEAEDVLQVLLSAIQIKREKRCGFQVLHRANLNKASSC